MPAAALIGLVGGIGGATIGAIGANSAADTQANAADQAAQLQAQEQERALDFQKQQWQTTQANEAPWLNEGRNALSTLSGMLQPGGQLAQGWNTPFVAPNAVTEQNDPGYQFRLQQGQDALERSAAAKGGVLTGGTARGLEDYAQNDASGEYGNVYNRALQQYQQQYNIFQQNQSNLFNRYSSLAGLGQQTAATLGNQAGAQGNTISNILLGGGAQIGQDIQNAAYQRGSGYAGVANALGSGLGNASSLLALSGMLNQNQSQSLANSTANDLTANAAMDSIPLGVG